MDAEKFLAFEVELIILWRDISSALEVALVGSGCLPVYQCVATPLTVMRLEVVDLLSLRSLARSASAELVRRDL